MVTDTVSKTVSITPSFTLLIAWEVSNHIPPCFHLLHNLWGWKAWPFHFIIINNLQDAHGKRQRAENAWYTYASAKTQNVITHWAIPINLHMYRTTKYYGTWLYVIKQHSTHYRKRTEHKLCTKCSQCTPISIANSKLLPLL